MLLLILYGNAWGYVQTGVVTANRVNLRSGPATTHAIIKRLSKGSCLLIHETGPHWLKVTHSGQDGYIYRKHVRFDEAAALDKDQPDSSFDVQSPDDVDVLTEAASRISRKISENTQQVAAYTQKEVDLIENLDQTERNLNNTRKEIKALKEKLTTLEKEQLSAQKAIDTLVADIGTIEEYAGKRLAALYKLHQLGKMPILASATSLNDLLFRKTNLEIILSNDDTLWRQLTQKKNILNSLKTSLEKQKETYILHEGRLKEQLEIMDRQKKKRAVLLNDIQQKKTFALAALDALQQAAKDLDKKIESLSWIVHTVVPDPEQPLQSFHTAKGLLNLPVLGKVKISSYFEKRTGKHSKSLSNGIDIKTDQGEPIYAIYGGETIYADWFKGYGNVIIIDHGNHYCSVYAHLQELFKKKGDPVDVKEVIGTVGDTGSLMGPKLHFEIRHHGKSVDPLAWFKSQ